MKKVISDKHVAIQVIHRTESISDQNICDSEAQNENCGVQEIQFTKELLEFLAENPICGRSDYTDLPGAKQNVQSSWRSFQHFPRRESLSRYANSQSTPLSSAVLEERQRKFNEARLLRQKKLEEQQQKKRELAAKRHAACRERKRLALLQRASLSKLNSDDGAKEDSRVVIISSPQKISPSKRKDFGKISKMKLAKKPVKGRVNLFTALNPYRISEDGNKNEPNVMTPDTLEKMTNLETLISDIASTDYVPPSQLNLDKEEQWVLEELSLLHDDGDGNSVMCADDIKLSSPKQCLTDLDTSVSSSSSPDGPLPILTTLVKASKAATSAPPDTSSDPEAEIWSVASSTHRKSSVKAVADSSTEKRARRKTKRVNYSEWEDYEDPAECAFTEEDQSPSDFTSVNTNIEDSSKGSEAEKVNGSSENPSTIKEYIDKSVSDLVLSKGEVSSSVLETNVFERDTQDMLKSRIEGTENQKNEAIKAVVMSEDSISNQLLSCSRENHSSNMFEIPHPQPVCVNLSPSIFQNATTVQSAAMTLSVINQQPLVNEYSCNVTSHVTFPSHCTYSPAVTLNQMTPPNFLLTAPGNISHQINVPIITPHMTPMFNGLAVPTNPTFSAVYPRPQEVPQSSPLDCRLTPMLPSLTSFRSSRNNVTASTEFFQPGNMLPLPSPFSPGSSIHTDKVNVEKVRNPSGFYDSCQASVFSSNSGASISQMRNNGRQEISGQHPKPAHHLSVPSNGQLPGSINYPDLHHDNNSHMYGPKRALTQNVTKHDPMSFPTPNRCNKLGSGPTPSKGENDSCSSKRKFEVGLANQSYKSAVPTSSNNTVSTQPAWSARNAPAPEPEPGKSDQSSWKKQKVESSSKTKSLKEIDEMLNSLNNLPVKKSGQQKKQSTDSRNNEAHPPNLSQHSHLQDPPNLSQHSHLQTSNIQQPSFPHAAAPQLSHRHPKHGQSTSKQQILSQEPLMQYSPGAPRLTTPSHQLSSVHPNSNPNVAASAIPHHNWPLKGNNNITGSDPRPAQKQQNKTSVRQLSKDTAIAPTNSMSHLSTPPLFLPHHGNNLFWQMEQQRLRMHAERHAAESLRKQQQQSTHPGQISHHPRIQKPSGSYPRQSQPDPMRDDVTYRQFNLQPDGNSGMVRSSAPSMCLPMTSFPHLPVQPPAAVRRSGSSSSSMENNSNGQNSSTAKSSSKVSNDERSSGGVIASPVAAVPENPPLQSVKMEPRLPLPHSPSACNLASASSSTATSSSSYLSLSSSSTMDQISDRKPQCSSLTKMSAGTLWSPVTSVTPQDLSTSPMAIASVSELPRGNNKTILTPYSDNSSTVAVDMVGLTTVTAASEPTISSSSSSSSLPLTSSLPSPQLSVSLSLSASMKDRKPVISDLAKALEAYKARRDESSGKEKWQKVSRIISSTLKPMISTSAASLSSSLSLPSSSQSSPFPTTSALMSSSLSSIPKNVTPPCQTLIDLKREAFEVDQSSVTSVTLSLRATCETSEKQMTGTVISSGLSCATTESTNTSTISTTLKTFSSLAPSSSTLLPEDAHIAAESHPHCHAASSSSIVEVSTDSSCETTSSIDDQVVYTMTSATLKKCSSLALSSSTLLPADMPVASESHPHSHAASLSSVVEVSTNSSCETTSLVGCQVVCTTTDDTSVSNSLGSVPVSATLNFDVHSCPARTTCISAAKEMGPLMDNIAEPLVQDVAGECGSHHPYGLPSSSVDAFMSVGKSKDSCLTNPIESVTVCSLSCPESTLKLKAGEPVLVQTEMSPPTTSSTVCLPLAVSSVPVVPSPLAISTSTGLTTVAVIDFDPWQQAHQIGDFALLSSSSSLQTTAFVTQDHASISLSSSSLSTTDTPFVSVVTVCQPICHPGPLSSEGHGHDTITSTSAVGLPPNISHTAKSAGASPSHCLSPGPQEESFGIQVTLGQSDSISDLIRVKTELSEDLPKPESEMLNSGIILSGDDYYPGSIIVDTTESTGTSNFSLPLVSVNEEVTPEYEVVLPIEPRSNTGASSTLVSKGIQGAIVRKSSPSLALTCADRSNDETLKLAKGNVLNSNLKIVSQGSNSCSMAVVIPPPKFVSTSVSLGVDHRISSRRLHPSTVDVLSAWQVGSPLREEENVIDCINAFPGVTSVSSSASALYTVAVSRKNDDALSDTKVVKSELSEEIKSIKTAHSNNGLSSTGLTTEALSHMKQTENVSPLPNLMAVVSSDENILPCKMESIDTQSFSKEITEGSQNSCHMFDSNPGQSLSNEMPQNSEHSHHESEFNKNPKLTLESRESSKVSCPKLNSSRSQNPSDEVIVSLPSSCHEFDTVESPSTLDEINKSSQNSHSVVKSQQNVRLENGVVENSQNCCREFEPTQNIGHAIEVRENSQIGSIEPESHHNQKLSHEGTEKSQNSSQLDKTVKEKSAAHLAGEQSTSLLSENSQSDSIAKESQVSPETEIKSENEEGITLGSNNVVDGLSTENGINRTEIPGNSSGKRSDIILSNTYDDPVFIVSDDDDDDDDDEIIIYDDDEEDDTIMLPQPARAKDIPVSSVHVDEENVQQPELNSDQQIVNSSTVSEDAVSTISSLSGVSGESTKITNRSIHALGSWTKEEVSVWLKKNKLDKICLNLSNLDGPGLQRMAFECHRDHEVFYSRVKKSLGLTMFQTLVIIRSLKSLIQEDENEIQ